jgi:hypothetical protein
MPALRGGAAVLLDELLAAGAAAWPTPVAGAEPALSALAIAAFGRWAVALPTRLSPPAGGL